MKLRCDALALNVYLHGAQIYLGLKVLYRNKQFFPGGSILCVGSTAPGMVAAALVAGLT